MMRFTLVPRGIVWQLIILVTITAAIFHACMGFAFYVARSAELTPPAGPVVGPIVDLADAVDLLPAERRSEFVSRFAARHPHLHAEMLASGGVAPAVPAAAGSSLARLLGPKLPAGSVVRSSGNDHLILRLRDGTSISLTPDAHPAGPPQFTDLAFATTLFVALSTTLFLVWGLRNIAIPLATFAEAADRFTLDERDELLSEEGSAEVRMASRAFNRMQARIRSMVADRTRMLASIGHDLRTPITRLRLRTESISDAAVKQAMIRDLECMDGLVEGALTFLRDSGKDRIKQSLDLGSLLQSICDDFTDTGSPVCFEGPNHLAVDAHPDDLRRMFSNVVANAVLYAEHVSVILKGPVCSHAEVDVCDDGPGMTDADKKRAFEPFWRGAQSGDDQRGFGLGLSIVRAISDAHAGTVTLLDAPAGGLVCRIRLPCLIDSRPARA